MGRLTNGLRARRGTLLTLLAITAVVAAGVVTAFGFAEAAGTSRWLSLPLLLIGAVAIPACGHELAMSRRTEIGIARLRGVHGGRLLALLLVEPALAVLAGALLGALLGVAGTWLSTRLWLDEAGTRVGAGTWLAVGAVLVVALLGVLVGLSAARREPLGDQVSLQSRPRTSSTAGVFAGVLVIVAAIVAVYRSGRSPAEGAEGDPDWVVQAGPALIGLAVGVLAVAALKVGARLLTRRTTHGGLPGFLAGRRLGRTADAVSPLRMAVAAGAVATLAATAAGGVLTWTEQQARLQTGAPTQYVMDDRDAAAALALAREADPGGEWLMAGAVVLDSQARSCRAFLDTPRYDTVVGDYLDGTGAAGVADDLAGLRALESDRYVDARRLRLELEGIDEVPAGLGVQVEVDLVDRVGRAVHASGVFGRYAQSTVAGLDLRVPDCAGGCLVTRMGARLGSSSFPGDFFATFGTHQATVRVASFRIGEQDLKVLDWASRRQYPGLDLAAGLDRLTLYEGDGLSLDNTSAQPPLPLLATAGLDLPDDLGTSVVRTLGGDDRDAEVVGSARELPLVGAAGLLGDLETSLYGSGPTIPAATVFVLARDGTPRELLARVVEAGAERRTTGSVRHEIAVASGAAQANVYLLLAGCCLAVAVCAALATAARQRGVFRRDVAALRVVGVPLDEARRAGRTELAVLAATTVLAGVGAGLLAAWLLLDDLPLVTVPPFASRPPAVGSPLPAVLVALLLAAIVLLVGGWARRIDPAETRPALLREDAAR